MKVTVAEKFNNFWLEPGSALRILQTYDNVLWYDSFYSDSGIPYNRLWLEDGNTATFNSRDYFFIL